MSRETDILGTAQSDYRRNRAVPVSASRDHTEQLYEAAKQRADRALGEAAAAVDQVMMMWADELLHDKATSMILGPFPAECERVKAAIWGLP